MRWKLVASNTTFKKENHCSAFLEEKPKQLVLTDVHLAYLFETESGQNQNWQYFEQDQEIISACS
jgi:hypothetical protein